MEKRVVEKQREKGLHVVIRLYYVDYSCMLFRLFCHVTHEGIYIKQVKIDRNGKEVKIKTS